MKNIPLLLGSLVLILFISCGNDTVTNNDPVPGEEVIFSMDSFAINLENGTVAIDTSIRIAVPNIKLVFDCSTNVDSVNSNAYLRITSMDSISIYLDTIVTNITDLNRHHMYNIYGSPNYYTSVYLQLTQTSITFTFLKLANLKVFKI